MSSDNIRKVGADDIRIEDPMDFLTAAEKEAYLSSSKTAARQPVYEELEVEDFGEEEDDGYEEDVYEDDAYEDGDDASYDEDGYDEEDAYDDPAPGRRPVKKKAVKSEKPHAARQSAPQKKQHAHAAQAAADEGEEVSAMDRGLSAMTRILGAVIALMLLAIVWLIVLRPMVYSALGWNRWQEEGGAINLADEGMSGAAAQGESAATQEETPAGGAESTAPQEEGERVRTTTGLNLRNAPNTTTSEIITAVDAGTSLIRLAEADGWSTVLYEGQTLYCVSEFLEAD